MGFICTCLRTQEIQKRVLRNFALLFLFFFYKIPFVISYLLNAISVKKVEFIVFKNVDILTVVIVHQFRKRRYRRLPIAQNVKEI